MDETKEREKDREMQEALGRFSEEDAIMNKETLQIAEKYIMDGGPPIKVLRALVEGYRGYAALCNLLARQYESSFADGADKKQELGEVDEMGETGKRLEYAAVKQTLLEIFNEEASKKMKAKHMSAEIDGDGGQLQGEEVDEQEKIDEIIENKECLKMIYEIAEQCPNSEFLNRLVQKISEKVGYERDGEGGSGEQRESDDKGEERDEEEGEEDNGSENRLGFGHEEQYMGSSNYGASLHIKMFYKMLTDNIEALAHNEIEGGKKVETNGQVEIEDDEVVMERLWQLMGHREHTYFLGLYIMKEAQQRAGEKGYVLQRIIEAMRSRLYKMYERPMVGTRIQILLEGMEVGGRDSLSSALESMLQSDRAAPGDVLALYRAYHDSLESATSLSQIPRVGILRSGEILGVLIREVFGFVDLGKDINDDNMVQQQQNQQQQQEEQQQKSQHNRGMLRDTLEEKYMWLIAYSVVANDRDVHGEQQYDSEAQEILRVKNSVYEYVKVLRELRQRLEPITTSIDFNKKIRWLVEISKTPLVAMVIVEWISSVVVCADNFAYLETYYLRQGEVVPMPLLVVEELAYRHPALRPMVFGVYRKILMQARIEQFPPEKQADLYKMVVQLMINLAGMGYSLQTTRFFYGLVLGQSIDISLVVFYISRVVRTIVTPYPAELVNLLLKIIVRILSPLLESCTINSDLDINNNMDVDANADTSNTENGGTDADGENTYFYLLRFLKNIKSAYYNRNGQPTLSPTPKNETNERVLVADIEKLDMGAIEASGLIIRIMNQL